MWNSPLPGPPLGISVAHLIPVPFLKSIRSLLFKYQGHYIGHLAFLYSLSALLLSSHLLQAVFNTWYYWLLPFSQMYDMSPLNFLGQIMLCIWDQTVGISWLFASFSALTIIQNSCSTQYRKSIFWPPSSPFVSCFPSTYPQNLYLVNFVRNLMSSKVNTHLSRMKSKYKHWTKKIQIAFLAKYLALMCSPQKVKAGSCWLWSLRVGTSFYQTWDLSKNRIFRPKILHTESNSVNAFISVILVDFL